MQSVSAFAAAEELQAIPLDELLQVHAPNVYLVKIHGDSMQGAGIFDEDVVIVDKAIDSRAGHIVIAGERRAGLQAARLCWPADRAALGQPSVRAEVHHGG